MHKDTGFPETLHEAIQYFAAGDNAFHFMVALRWRDGVVCPTCGSGEVHFVRTRKIWECKTKHPKRQFSVKVGTIFEDSPIKLDKWFSAMWMLGNCKNGVSSYEIGRELGVTQKTGWFMLHRLRAAMQSGSFVRDKMSGTVEVDESYIGGAARNMHHKAKVRRGLVGNSGINGKTIVMGILERGKGKKASRVVTEIVKDTSEKEIMPHVRKYVLKGTEMQTDALRTYRRAEAEYQHKVVDHAESYVRDGVHTNGLENFWSLLKRTIKGTYVSVEPFHLFRYLSEQCFRFNERKDDNHGRFLSIAGGIVGKRLTYAKLIGDDDGLPAAV